MTPEDDLLGFSWVIKDLATTLVRVVFASHAEHCIMTTFLGRNCRTRLSSYC